MNSKGYEEVTGEVTRAEKPTLSTTRLVLLTSCMAGVQVSYAAQTNLGTPQLLFLGLPQRVISFAWIAGPLSGLIVQPLVGRWSDRTRSKYGRRIPFLLAGAVLTSFAMLLFGNAGEIADLVRRPKLALPIAIFAFFLLDFAVQAVQAPLRMLVTDLVPAQQRAMTNCLLATFTGVGLLLGGLLAGFQLELYVPIFSTHAQALFAFASLILMSTTVVCTLAVGEKSSLHDWQTPSSETLPLNTETSESYIPIPDEERQLQQGQKEQDEQLPVSKWQRLERVPSPYWACFFVQLCTWVGFFTLFVYVTSWVGTNIFLGDGTKPKGSPGRINYEAGVRLAGRANAVQAIVTILYSFIIPHAWRVFGVRSVYVFSQLMQAVTLLAAPFIRGPPTAFMKNITILDIAAYGVVWATTMSVPWTLIGGALASDPWYAGNVGLFQTIFNASQSGPQLIVCIILSPIILYFVGDDPAWVMFAGGVFALIGALLVIVLDVREDNTATRLEGVGVMLGILE